MHNDTLKARLDALSEAECRALNILKNSETKSDKELGDWLAATAELSAALRDRFRSGDLVTKDQLEQAVRERLNDLPWREKDIKRGLILFRTSNNAHGFTNYSSLSSKVDALPDAAKEELAAIMTNMAIGFSKEDVLANGIVKQAIAEAVAAEREACAKVCETKADKRPDSTNVDWSVNTALLNIAAHIRARTEGESQ